MASPFPRTLSTRSNPLFFFACLFLAETTLKISNGLLVFPALTGKRK
jgi:hypothetical protein